jgi:hypothetical protein
MAHGGSAMPSCSIDASISVVWCSELRLAGLVLLAPVAVGQSHEVQQHVSGKE